jgi:hypothetical protein
LLATLAICVRTDLLGPANQHWYEPADHWKYEYMAQNPLGSFHISANVLADRRASLGEATAVFDLA